jgi:hypothetical protein
MNNDFEKPPAQGQAIRATNGDNFSPPMICPILNGLAFVFQIGWIAMMFQAETNGEKLGIAFAGILSAAIIIGLSQLIETVARSVFHSARIFRQQAEMLAAMRALIERVQ